MKKRISRLFSLLLALALCGAGCASTSDDSQNSPQTEPLETTVQTEAVETVTTVPVETEPPYRLMVITGSTLNVRSGPGAGYEIVGQVHAGDLVQVWEEADGWGRIEQGWISLSYAEDYLDEEDPYAPGTGTSSGQPGQNTTPGQPTDPTQSGNQGQDMSYLIMGVWYSYYKSSDGTYNISSRDFRNGVVIDKEYDYDPETGKTRQNGGSEGTYSYDGTYVTVDCPPYAYNDRYPIRLSGNTMYWGTEGWILQRMSWEEVTAQIRKEASGQTLNTALVGSWYRSVAAPDQNWGYVDIYTFDAQGKVQHAGIQFEPENPRTDANMGTYTFDYTYDGTTLTIDDGKNINYSVTVGGDSISFGGHTYRRGTVNDGFAELASMFNDSVTTPTQPQTEPTQEQTTPVTEQTAPQIQE